MKPLYQFICDYCGEMIKQPGDGILEFLSERDAKMKKHCSEFKIVHQGGSSPFEDAQYCHHHYDECYADLPINHILTDAHEILKRNFSNEYGKSSELKEIENRLTIPYFEEARQYLDKAVKDGLITNKEDILYGSPSPVLLESIIQKYKK